MLYVAIKQTPPPEDDDDDDSATEQGYSPNIDVVDDSVSEDFRKLDAVYEENHNQSNARAYLSSFMSWLENTDPFSTIDSERLFPHQQQAQFVIQFGSCVGLRSPPLRVM
jgi:hypothetical protein